MKSAKRSSSCSLHSFSDAGEVARMRESLLQWYDSCKRDLPWRTAAAAVADPNVRAYAVWVSEVMLQQTRVATVIDYYKRWMKRWPTVGHLAMATVEEVREVWSGLGYYTRAVRLWEAAKKVTYALDGNIPSTAEELATTLPGVGRYTASAIASIAFGQACGVVDGNVVRVFSRVQAIGADAGSQLVTEHLWSLAEAAVDGSRPGDFNQAVMELGAMICTPKSPHCSACPISSLCKAHCMASEDDKQRSLKYFSVSGQMASGSVEIEDCSLCLPKDSPWDSSLREMNFPRKAKKKPPKIEHFAVMVAESVEGGVARLLLRKRPDSGLLAGLWEFPCTAVQSDWSQQKMWEELKSRLLSCEVEKSQFLGELTHCFSHIHHHYHVWHVVLQSEQLLLPSNELPGDSGARKWIGCCDLEDAAISTAVRKIHKLLSANASEPREQPKTKKQKLAGSSREDKKQKTMDTFFSAYKH